METTVCADCRTVASASIGDGKEIMANENSLSSFFSPQTNDYGLFFVFCAVAIGIVIRFLSRSGLFTIRKSFTLPYPVIILILGFILGVIDSYANLGALSFTIETWRNIGGRALVLILLPPILFSASFPIDFHTFYRLFVQIFILAVPGTIISALLTAACVYGIFPEDWDFVTGMLVGSILAATDPVSVVALLRDIGAPEKVSVLIEGESLLNDGIAYALFITMLSIVSGETNPSVGQTIGLVVYVVVVGVAIGIACGVVTLTVMVYIWNDATIEIGLTLIMTWGVFLLGDAVGASGVLAVVSFGLTFSSHRVGHVSSEVKVALEQVWLVLEFIANTLIFFYTGVESAFTLLGNADEFSLTNLYVLKTVAVFVLLNIIRFFVVALFYFPLSKTGYGMDLKRALVLSWSGIRGAVGLIAAIEVAESDDCIPGDTSSTVCVEPKLQAQVLFTVSEIVVLSILINGLSMQWIISKLGIAARSSTSRRNFEYSIHTLNEVMGGRIAASKVDPKTAGADFKKVWSFMPVLLSTGDYEQNSSLCSDVTNPGGEAQTDPHLIDSLAVGIDQASNLYGEALAETRYRFLLFVRAQYLHQFETGTCGSWPTLRILNEATSSAIDSIDEPADEWQWIDTRYCRLHDWREKVDRITHISFFTRKFVVKSYDLVSSFVCAHEIALEKIAPSARSLGTFEAIETEQSAVLRRALKFMGDLEAAFDDVVSSFRTWRAITETLNYMSGISDEMHRQAEIEDHDYGQIKTILRNQLSKVKRRMGYVEVRTPSDLFRSATIFTGVDEKTIGYVKKHAHFKQFEPGESLVDVDGEESDVYVIIRGRVKCFLYVAEEQQLRDIPARGAKPTDYSSGSMHSMYDAMHQSTLVSVKKTPSVEFLTPKSRPRHFSFQDNHLRLGSSPDLTEQLRQIPVVHEGVLETLEKMSEQQKKDRNDYASSCMAYKLCSDVQQYNIQRLDIISGHEKKLELKETKENNVEFEDYDLEDQDRNSLEQDNFPFHKDNELVYGRGEVVGDLAAVAQSKNVARVACQSIVAAYVIPRRWLLHFIQGTNANDKMHSSRVLLGDNISRHAALRALEPWFPLLRSTSDTLRSWLQSKLEIYRPPPNTMVECPFEEGGIEVLLRGRIRQIGESQVNIGPITVLDIPQQKQKFEENTLTILLPRSATRLLFSRKRSEKYDFALRNPTQRNQTARLHRRATSFDVVVDEPFTIG